MYTMELNPRAAGKWTRFWKMITGQNPPPHNAVMGLAGWHTEQWLPQLDKYLRHQYGNILAYNQGKWHLCKVPLRFYEHEQLLGCGYGSCWARQNGHIIMTANVVFPLDEDNPIVRARVTDIQIPLED